MLNIVQLPGNGKLVTMDWLVEKPLTHLSWYWNFEQFWSRDASVMRPLETHR